MLRRWIWRPTIIVIRTNVLPSSILGVAREAEIRAKSRGIPGNSNPLRLFCYTPEMAKEVIWVFGTSASGKETFIKEVVGEGKYADKLNCQDKNLSFAKSSLENIGHFDDDPVLQKRAKIVNEVKSLLEMNDLVLIKWQFVDSEAGRVEALKVELPNVKHKIVVLTATDEKLSERLRSKKWWAQGENTQKWIDEERELLTKELEKYNDFEIIMM